MSKFYPKGASWLNPARSIIEALLIEACQERCPTKKEFWAFLREHYPWSRTGWAYKSWQKERACCTEYLALVQKGQAKPEHFASYSLAKMRSARVKVEPIEGQQSIFGEVKNV